MDKQSLRERVWDELEESGEARFPFPPHGRIPNFAGADGAADHLTELAEWRAADAVKANPDSPQRPVRRRALEAGKTVYMAVPRLRDEECFLELDPDRIDDYDTATTLSGSSELGVQVRPPEMDPVNFVVSGSVVVDDRGARIGKGEGYSDLEFAVLRELGLVNESVTVATTVHEIQFSEEALPTSPHDVPMDYVVTPERTVETGGEHKRPTGIDWDALREEKIAEIPVLQEMQP